MKKIMVLAFAMCFMLNANAQFGKLKGALNKVKNTVESVEKKATDTKSNAQNATSTATGTVTETATATETTAAVTKAVADDDDFVPMSGMAGKENPYCHKSFAKDYSVETATKADTLDNILAGLIYRILLIEKAGKENNEAVLYHGYMRADKQLDYLISYSYKYPRIGSQSELVDAMKYWRRYCLMRDVYDYQDKLTTLELQWSKPIPQIYKDAMAYLNKINEEPASIKKCMMLDHFYEIMKRWYFGGSSYDAHDATKAESQVLSAGSTAEEKEYTALCEKVIATVRPVLGEYGKEVRVMNVAEVNRLKKEAEEEQTAADYAYLDSKPAHTMAKYTKLAQSNLDPKLKSEILAAAKALFPTQYVDVVIEDGKWTVWYDRIFKNIIINRSMEVNIITKENGGKYYIRLMRYLQDYSNGSYGKGYFNNSPSKARIEYK